MAGWRADATRIAVGLRELSISDCAALGDHHGMKFGLQFSSFGSPELYLEGSIRRSTMMFREHLGPRAVLNGLKRLTDSYPEQIRAAERDLELAQQQLADYRAASAGILPMKFTSSS